MELRFANKELAKQCTDERYMKRTLSLQVVKALRLRLNELLRASDMDELLQFPGKWEAKTADRSGQWSSHLTKNWRLIVEPEADGVVVRVIEIVDYH